MSTNRVLRYEIPVDDQPHQIAEGLPLMACPWRQSQFSAAGRVEIWVEVDAGEDWPNREPVMRSAQVFGTGQLLPDGAVWLASCLDGSLVWHVYEVEA